MRLSFMHLLIWQALKRIELHPHEAKRIGINYDQFLCCSRSSWSSTSTKQIEIERTKVRINAKGGGRKAEMSAQGVCLCLVYLRQNPFLKFWVYYLTFLKLRLMTRSIIGLRFWETFYQLLKWKKEDVQKYKELRQLLTEYQLIVDSTEQPIVRPIDYELQKDYYYSGKMHTLKINLLFYHKDKIL